MLNTSEVSLDGDAIKLVFNDDNGNDTVSITLDCDNANELADMIKSQLKSKREEIISRIIEVSGTLHRWAKKKGSFKTNIADDLHVELDKIAAEINNGD